MAENSDEEDLPAAPEARAGEQAITVLNPRGYSISCFSIEIELPAVLREPPFLSGFFSATILTDGNFHAELGWPAPQEEWRAGVGPLRLTVWPAGQFRAVFDQQWTAIAVSVSAKVKIELGVFKVSMSVTMGISVQRTFSEPDERGSVSPVWEFSLHSHGGMSVEVAGVRFSSSWSYGCRGVSTYGPPLLATAPRPLLLHFVRD